MHSDGQTNGINFIQFVCPSPGCSMVADDMTASLRMVPLRTRTYGKPSRRSEAKQHPTPTLPVTKEGDNEHS